MMYFWRQPFNCFISWIVSELLLDEVILIEMTFFNTEKLRTETLIIMIERYYFSDIEACVCAVSK